MKIIIPQIPISKDGVSMTNKDFLMHLWPSSSFGSLNLKFWDYHNRHLYMNKLLCDIYNLHTLEKQFMDGEEYYSLRQEHTTSLFMTESLTYWVRKNIDEIISMNYYFDYLQTFKSEPKKLIISSIGSLLHNDKHSLYELFKEHLSQLDIINNISNTFKHSFINSEVHNMIGREEPTVNCLDLKWNDASNKPVFHTFYLSEIIEYYCDLFFYARDTIKKIDLESLVKK